MPVGRSQPTPLAAKNGRGTMLQLKPAGYTPRVSGAAGVSSFHRHHPSRMHVPPPRRTHTVGSTPSQQVNESK